MIVVIPMTITDGLLSDNTAPQSSTTDYPGLVDWTAGTYAADAYVRYAPENNIYQANTSTATVPPTGAAENPPKWTLIGKDNQYRLFDGKVSSPTVADGGFGVAVNIASLGVVNSLAGFDISGVNEINITVTEGAEIIYDRILNMQDNTDIIDWWTYFFSPIKSKTSFAIYDLPATLTGELWMGFDTPSTASVGEIVIGNRYQIGSAIYGSGFQNADLSRVEYDDFGNVTGKIIRPNIDTVDFDVKIDEVSGQTVSYARSIMKRIGKTTECVWAGSTDENDDLLCYGFYESFSAIIYPTVSDCKITVRTAI
jgi:hypothetical protein